MKTPTKTSVAIPEYDTFTFWIPYDVEIDCIVVNPCDSERVWVSKMNRQIYDTLRNALIHTVNKESLVFVKLECVCKTDILTSLIPYGEYYVHIDRSKMNFAEARTVEEIESERTYIQVYSKS